MNQTTDFDHPMTDTIPSPTLTWNTEEDPDERPYLIYFPESGGELVQDGEKGSRSWTAHSGIAFATNLEDRHLEKLPQLLSAFPYLEASGIRTKVGALDEVASLKASLYGEEHRDQGMTAQSKLFKVLEEGLGVEVWTADNADMVKDRHDNRFFYRKPLSLASERSGGSPTMQGHTTTFNNSNIPPSFLTVKNRAQRFSPQALASFKTRQVQQTRESQAKRGWEDNDDGVNDSGDDLVDDAGNSHERKWSKRRACDGCDGEETGTEYAQVEEMSDV
jgi:hypothetical protein